MVEQLLNELFRIRREERGVVGGRLDVRRQRSTMDGMFALQSNSIPSR